LCAGISISWSAVTKSVTLRHQPSGACFIATPCGRIAFSSEPNRDIDLFADLATPQTQLAAAAASAPAADQAPPESEGIAGVAAVTAAAADAAAASGFAAGLLPLLDVCSQEQTWGLLGMDLCCGEAVIAEAGGCRLHQGPGAVSGTYVYTHSEQLQWLVVEICVRAMQKKDGHA
jgi:hypothetical protein